MQFQTAKPAQDFWTQRIELICGQMIPLQLQLLEDQVPGAEPSHAIDNFRIAAGLKTGAFYGMVFQDSDVGKWIEAASYKVKLQPDPELEAKIDEIVEIIGKAQQPDGYLNTYFTIKCPEKRWTNLEECHELYCAGHLIEGAVAYYGATGKTAFLDIVRRMADCIDRAFGPEPHKLQGCPGHPEVELALFRLYLATGEKRYLNLAKFFLDRRGQQPRYFDLEFEKRGGKQQFPGIHALGPTYLQDHKPVREQDEAVGHSVRALYLYAAMAHVARETGDEDLHRACKALWESAAHRKMYVTGAFGATHVGEAFMSDYELPNDSAYAETCAAIAMLFFGKALLQTGRDGEIADVMERVLYNGMLSGMSLEADRFFYVNPLETVAGLSGKQPGFEHVLPKRPKWFGCACCPPNLARLIASLPEYCYGEDASGISVHQYLNGTASFEGFGGVVIAHQSNYPWEGELLWTVEAAQPFTLFLRVPGWAKDPELTVNGKQIPAECESGYVAVGIDPSGRKTEIRLSLPLHVWRLYANPAVRQAAGCAAFAYGPMVYCFEGDDNPAPLSALRVKKEAQPQLLPFDERLLGGVRPFEVEGVRLDMPEGVLYQEAPARQTPILLKAIPYYAFANRESENMRVWMQEV